MKRDFATPLLDLNGKEFADKATMSAVCVQALIMDHPGEQTDGAEKYRRYKLAEKLHNNDIVDLTTDEIVLLKNLVAKAYTPLIYGRVHDFLEGTDAA